MLIKLNRFEELKNAPLWWYNKSSDLHASAGVLWLSMEDENKKKYEEELELASGFQMDIACFGPYCMLWGLSFELILKAVLTARGKRIPKSHNLNTLCKAANFQVKEQEIGVLKVLSKYITWRGKYPVPLESQDLEEFNELHTEYLCNKISAGNYMILQYNGALEWKKLDKFWKRGVTLFFNEYEECKYRVT